MAIIHNTRVSVTCAPLRCGVESPISNLFHAHTNSVSITNFVPIINNMLTDRFLGFSRLVLPSRFCRFWLLAFGSWLLGSLVLILGLSFNFLDYQTTRLRNLRRPALSRRTSATNSWLWDMYRPCPISGKVLLS